MRFIAGLIVLLLLFFGAAYVVAGRTAPPRLTIDRPERFVGRVSTLDVTVEAPKGHVDTLTIRVEQNGKAIGLFALDHPGTAAISQSGPNRIAVSRAFGKESVPELQAGAARIVATATRTSFLRLRTVSSTATKDIEIRLEPPRLAVVSTHHYVNHGGSEMVIYRATPADVRSGVRVGDVEYPGFPAGGAGLPGNDPALKVAFFALLHDQDLKTPIAAFARDDAGNESKVSFVDDVFEKPFKRSKIQLDDRFLSRVVPEILEHSPALKIADPSADDFVPAFLKINGELRQKNADEIAAIAAKTSASRLWKGPFVQLGNSQVEASFADHRTYFYNGKEVDQQVHLGFDLAVTSNVPVVAANEGVVLHASWLGIYGNCIIIDHGMGVQSLYGHLSSFDVGVGDKVAKSQQIARTGMTGLAGGDHLHFTMLVNGRMVNPVEWWDPHWVQDRVDRKLAEAGGAQSTASQEPQPQPVRTLRRQHRRR